MEKIFTPNRWFVLFCALLIVVWGALKLVGDMHLSEEAKLIARNILSWSWHEPAIEANLESVTATVLSRNAHEATVEISGTQKIMNNDNTETSNITKSEQARATLTFYRLNDRWELGKVEFN